MSLERDQGTPTDRNGWRPIDEATVLAARSGSLAAFELIVLRYERPIFSHLRRLVGSREDAEDLTQETFIKLYRQRGELDPTKHLPSWLFTVATHLAYDWLRRRRRQPVELLLDDPDQPLEAADPQASEFVVGKAHDLELALPQLRPVQQAVLLLYYQQDMSYHQIATVLSLPLNTVKTHLRRAKLALRRLLESHPSEPSKSH